MKTLHEILSKKNGSEFYQNFVPSYLDTCLNSTYSIRYYQREAIGRFVYYLKNVDQDRPIQLLYQMATGSGKTLIMSALILYLYEKGYRNFIFFVNSIAIIDKTRDNFLNFKSEKYLFSTPLMFNNKTLIINEVTNFYQQNSNDINIYFTTIQALHHNIQNPSENGISIDDFIKNNVVFISDEAHHLNAETKKQRSSEKKEAFSWESTVNNVFSLHKENILLEFTATADLSNPLISKKYKDKIIFDYSLKQFRIDGFSKEVKVLQSDTTPFLRGLQAVLLSQFRKKIFENNKLIVKPVILFKSKTIHESRDFYHDFLLQLKNLRPELVLELEKRSKGSILESAFSYFRNNGITFQNLILELQSDFSSSKLLVVNSKEESEEKQLAVNTLESESNPFRAIFAVDKLNEGWDVLNLFDIVRLYTTKDNMSEKVSKSTLSEAQLIGRGARYFPFLYSDYNNKFKRKFDNQLTHKMRICEELYYHSSYNPQYIKELNKALHEIGIKDIETLEVKIALTDIFKKSEFYQSGLYFTNKRISLVEKDKNSLMQFLKTDKTFKYQLSETQITEWQLFEQDLFEKEEKVVHKFILEEFDVRLIRKAINTQIFYRFSNLKNYFPKLESIIEFIYSPMYLAGCEIYATGTAAQFQRLNVNQKLNILQAFFEYSSQKILSISKEYIGTNTLVSKKIRNILIEKNIYITSDKVMDTFFKKESWYVFESAPLDTEQKIFLEFFKTNFSRFEKKNNDIYLITNFNYFKYYSKGNGKSYYPDFVLFARENKKSFKQILIFLEKNRTNSIKDLDKSQDFLILKDDIGNDISYPILYYQNDSNHEKEFLELFNNHI